MKIIRNRMDGRLVQALESFFEHTPQPTSHQIKILSRKHNYNRSNIYKWFWKKRKMTGRRDNVMIQHRRRGVPSQSHSSSELEEELDSDVSTSLAPTQNIGTPLLEAQPPPPESLIVVSQFASKQGNTWDALPESSSGSVENNGPLISSSDMLHLKNSRHNQSPAMVVHPPNPSRSVSSAEVSFSSSHLNVDHIFDPLTSREISVLEKVYALIPNPTSDDIAKLASRFIKEKEKEEEIQAWFLRRQNEQNSSTNNQEEMQFEIYNYNN